MPNPLTYPCQFFIHRHTYPFGAGFTSQTICLLPIYISLEQVLNNFVTPLTSYVERLMVDIGVFIVFINVKVYHYGVGI